MPALKLEEPLYHYKHCGLSHLYLVSGITHLSNAMPVDLPGLRRTLALYLLEKPERLIGEEMAFVLRVVSKTEAYIAYHLHLRRNIVASWSQSKRPLMPLVAEVVFRDHCYTLLGANYLGFAESIRLTLRKSMKAKSLQPDVIYMEREQNEWKVSFVPS